MSRAYLDHNATTPLRGEARDAMLAAMDVVGNPSSVHAEGRAAKAVVETARAQVAEAFDADRAQVVFTSGATEAAAMVMSAGWSRVLATPVEHDCIMAHRDRCNTWHDIALDQDGVVHPATLEKTETGPGDLCVVQAANSETGITQPMFDTPAWTSHTGAMVLCDAVQYAGKYLLEVNHTPTQFCLLSAHKFGGPKGVGALILPKGFDMAAMTPGGGQEMGRRAGTENVIGIAGFGAAAMAAARDVAQGRWDKIAEFRNILESSIAASANETIFVGKSADRLPNTSCFATPGWKGETQVMQMDLAGFAISAGSACSSGKVKQSRVLTAMGYDEATASSAIRVSLGLETTKEQVLAFAEAWGRAYRKFCAKRA